MCIAPQNVYRMEVSAPSLIELPDVYVWNSDSEQRRNAQVRHCAIPVLDLQEEGETLAKKLGSACRESGIFYVINHGISDEILQRTEQQAMRIFDIPLQKKLQATKSPGDTSGYGATLLAKFFRKLMWSEGFTIAGSPCDVAEKLWEWPSDNSAFIESIHEYTNEMLKLAKRLMKIVLCSLCIDPCNFSWCGENSQEEKERKEMSCCYAALQMNNYPVSPRPDQTIGMAEHTDSTFLTILHQTPLHVHSLHIKNSDGEWVAVPPLAGALLVNVGDLMQVVSNGKYRSVVHRVASSSERRLSLAYLWGPPLNEIIEPLEELVDEEHPVRFRALSWKEYLDARATDFRNALDSFTVSCV